MRRKNGNGTRPSAPGWAGRRVLEVAHRLNEECIAALARAAASEQPQADFNPVAGLSNLWRRLDGAGISRASRSPVLLVDLNFSRADWWCPVAQGLVPSSSRVGAGSVFPIEIARDLLREVLIETWSAARSVTRAVSLVFGLTPAVCEAIASLKVSAIDRIVLEHAHLLRPRWAENLEFWRRLLEASIAADEEVLAELHRYCLQLLGGDLIALHHEGSGPYDRAGSL